MKLIESFRQIEEDKKLASIFINTELLKIEVVQHINAANIYIQDEQLIHRRDIKALENKLNQSLFPRADGSIRIIEQYSYSHKTAEELYREYANSFPP